jgi:hypothetical protein
MIKPKQSQTVHIETLGDELSVYDWQRLQLHSLNPTAAQVFEMCDGQTSPEQMAARLDMPHAEAVVWQSLDELDKANLLQEPLVRPRGMSRRDFVKLSSAVALASIVSIVVPQPASAGTPLSPSLSHCVGEWSTNLGIIPADLNIYYFPFFEGEITDADLNGINKIKYCWTGNPAPGEGVYSRLASGNTPSGSPWAGGPVLRFRTSTYVVRDSTTWMGNRPYQGISFQNTTGIDWEAGTVYVALRSERT